MDHHKDKTSTIEKENTKKSWIQYGVLAVVVITLYATGLHREAIGFVQRGMLSTGLMNPNVEASTEENYAENTDGVADTSASVLPTADFNFTLIDKEGNTKSLEDLRGKVIFLNIWATWCPPCIAEMPSISELHQEMGDDVAFVMLSVDDDFEKAKIFNQKKGYNLPIFATGGPMPAMYQSSSIPTTFIINKNGELALTHKGMADYSSSDFKKFMKSLL